MIHLQNIPKAIWYNRSGHLLCTASNVFRSPGATTNVFVETKQTNPLHSQVYPRSYCQASALNVTCDHQSEQVKVRFAPSPTGLLHLGSIRTAFINYLFARKHNGLFILRIEDTDQTRVVPGAVDKIQETLEWCGIKPDEGPSNGQRFKPYLQSQRVHLYQKYANQLLEQGHAYRCFCDEITLNLIRREAVRTRQTPRYDNRCRHLTQQQIDQKLASGQKYTVRFKLTSGPVAFNDIVMSDICIDLSETESDFVILKSDAFPTYHLANVVDDHYMQITHVLRGIEWLHSTPKHLMLYSALGWKPPLFAHLPLILNQGGGKLSKRHEHVNLQSLQRDGFQPESILNYLASIGGGFHLDLSHNNSVIYTIDELVDAFDVNLIRNVPNKLDNEKLIFFNKLALQKAIDCRSPEFLAKVRTLIENKFETQVSQDALVNNLIILRDRLSNINEIVDQYAYFWTDDHVDTNFNLNLDAKQSEQIIDNALHLFAHCDGKFDANHFDMIKQFCARNSIKYAKYLQLIRLALTGKQSGLPISELYEHLGQQSVIRKINKFKVMMSDGKCEAKQA